MKINVKKLKPLLASYPSVKGDTWIGSGKNLRAVCASCGLGDNRIMIRKHKKNCAYKQYWNAYEYLKSLLNA